MDGAPSGQGWGMRCGAPIVLICVAVATGCGGGDGDPPDPEPRTPEAAAESVNELMTALLVERDYAQVCAQLAPKAVEGLQRAAAEAGSEADDCPTAAEALYGDLPDTNEVPALTARNVTVESDSAVVDAPGPGGNAMTLVYEGGSWLAMSPLFTR